MSDDETGASFGDADFEAIEAAVMETGRGRWFLREYARRNRNADTQAVLDAIGSLTGAVAGRSAARRMRAGLADMATAIRQTKLEVRSFPHVAKDDPLNALSDEEFQAAAEQRIRRMAQTLHYLEGRIAALSAECGAGAGPERTPFSEAPPDETAERPHPHPSFLM